MIIDAYAHVGLPRFQTLSDYETVMKSAGIDRAVLVGFDSSPDLPEVYGGLVRRPADFRVMGVPIGRDRARMEAAVQAQFTAGFSGLRLTDGDVTLRPWLLDALGTANGIAIVCGQVSSAELAIPLLSHLEKFADTTVIGGHFAGPRDPAALEAGPVAELFAHPRFSVIWSRHGGYASAELERWSEALVERVGWQRLLWGSEAPVMFWRNETIESALAWVDRFAPADAQRAAFLGENAERIFFRSAPVVGELTVPFDLWEDAAVIPSDLWANGLSVNQRLAGRLVHAWIADEGATNGPLGSYLERLLDQNLPPVTN